MAKHVYRPLAPLKPGNSVRWKDSDGAWLIKNGVYIVSAVQGHFFNLDHIPILWGWEESQFEKVE